MVTQSFNNADYYTGPSLVPRLSVGMEKKRAWYPLFVHAHNSWEIGNYISYLPYTVCTSNNVKLV